MMYALTLNGERIEAQTGLAAVCPLCHVTMIPKCGEILQWHWAHTSMQHGDAYWEPETAWHLGWKGLFAPDQREVPVSGHIADIRLDADPARMPLVIELQHSSIGPVDIRSRERTYRHMLWIIDAAPFLGNLIAREHQEYVSFRWKHPRQSLWSIRQRMCWDMGDGILWYVKKIHHEIPCGGWAYRISVNKFLAAYAKQ